MRANGAAAGSHQQLTNGRTRSSVAKGGQAERAVVKYFCTFQNTVADVLAARGWEEVDDDNTWDFVWADRDWIYSAFDKMHLDQWQRLNHFRNGRELCRKDLMAKNLKRRRRTLEKEGKIEEAQSYDFIPTTFVLPREYSMFVEEFKKTGGVWIMKGKGIFLFTRLSEISEWKTDFKSYKPAGAKDKDDKEVEAYVVQRYLQYPLLIGGKKFDMRLYVLVTSFSPMKVYLYRRGFARFTNSRYSSDVQDIYNGFVHLTNVAIQKTAENYDERTGGKMELQAMKLFLMSKHSAERVDALFWEIQMIILRSLLAVQQVMINDKHCFELYGYDVIIDQDLKPWLLEVNASPSLTANTKEDYMMKTEMLHGMLDIVDMEGILRGDEEHVSGWDLVYDNNGYIEIDPEHCGYSTFLGAAVPEADTGGDDSAEEAPREGHDTGGMQSAGGARARVDQLGAGRRISSPSAARDDDYHDHDDWELDGLNGGGSDGDAAPPVAAKPPAGAKERRGK